MNFELGIVNDGKIKLHCMLSALKDNRRPTENNEFDTTR